MRTHYCGLVDQTLIGQTLTLAGWTDVARNLGGVCFIDLRDHEGIVQVTVEPSNVEVFAVAASLGYEDVIQVEGVVRAREAVNTKIRSGQVELPSGFEHYLLSLTVWWSLPKGGKPLVIPKGLVVWSMPII